MPKDFKLQDCYLCIGKDLKDETAEANAHLLSALGEFKDKSFVPVTINNGYMGYSWTKLPKVTKVEVSKSGEKLRHSINCSEIACFDDLIITVHTSNGKKFSSNVDMAVVTEPPRGKYQWIDQLVCVTKDARNHLSSDNIWFHIGGFDLEGDSYDTQLYYFEKELDEFWNELVGPYESLRSELLSALSGNYGLYDKWQKITIAADNSLEIFFKDGKKQRVNPPA